MDDLVTREIATDKNDLNSVNAATGLQADRPA